MRRLKIPAAELAALAGEVVDRGGRLSFLGRLSGASMEPSLSHGDRLALEAVPVEELREGEVVIYRKGTGQLVAHRLQEIRLDAQPPLLVLRSEAPVAPMEEIPAAAVIGRLVQARRHPIPAFLRRLVGGILALRTGWRLDGI